MDGAVRSNSPSRPVLHLPGMADGRCRHPGSRQALDVDVMTPCCASGYNGALKRVLRSFAMADTPPRRFLGTS